MKKKSNRILNILSIISILVIICLVVLLFLIRSSGKSDQTGSDSASESIAVTSSLPSDSETVTDAEGPGEHGSTSSATLIKQIITEKGHGSDVQDMLDKLKAEDYSTGVLWENILTYWDQVNEDAFTGKETLPDNLPTDDSLCIVVMGYGLLSDGSMRDDLVLRLIEALKCADQYPNAWVLVTGGGTASENKEATEAGVMAQWLIDNGLDENRIIIENKSLTTAANALYSQAILYRDYPQVKSIAIVTSDYHVPLSCLLFNAQFMIADAAAGRPEAGPRVVANASCIPDSSYVFTPENQANWLNVLFDGNNQ